MKVVSTLALAAALAVGGIAAAPAAAQNKAKADKSEKAQAPAEKKLEITKEARAALQALQEAVRAKNTAEFAERLAAAEAVAKNADEKYFVAKMRLEHAITIGDKAAQLTSLESLIASGAADPAETVLTQRLIAQLAQEAGDYAKSEAALAAVLAADANDLEATVNMARAKMELDKQSEALELLQRAIALSKAAGQTPPESWYRNALQIAHGQRNSVLASRLAEEVLQAYPGKENFGNLIAISAPVIARDEEAYVDLLRLMQVSGTMRQADDYLRLAEYLDYNRNWGEAKAVLDAAASAGKSGPKHSALLSKVTARLAEDRAALPSAEPKARGAADGKLAASLAEVYAGYGDYTKAAELYRLALQKGGVDADLVNTRLGIALAKGGQRAEAEAALKAVTGSRETVADLWLAWLAQRG